MSKRTILLVEDDEAIRLGLEDALRGEGYGVLSAANGTEGLRLGLAEDPDLILLDLMLPGLRGIQFLKILRGTDRVRDIPVMIMSAKNSETDIVAGLDAGADDYLTKPFSVQILLARVRALLRRTKENARHTVRHCGIEINTETHRATVDGEEVQLARKEFELLLLFLNNPEKVFTRNQLLNTIWGYESDIVTRTVDAHVSSLRKKLGEKGRLIRSVPRIGYRMEHP